MPFSQVTNWRVNALENVLIPKFENTVKCASPITNHLRHSSRWLTRCVLHTDIISELDEMDREEFFRLKKVQDKKARDMAIKEAEEAAAGVQSGGGGGPDLLEQTTGGGDDDLLF